MIYITGDTHGDINDLLSRKINKIKKGDKLIICGDFGFLWDNSPQEQKNLQKLSKKNFDILFVEGAHENFEMIHSCKEVDLYRGRGYKIAKNIYCMKRGEVYEIESKRIFTLGGGADIEPLDDSYMESPSMPSDDEYLQSVNNLDKYHRDVDIIITHEAPASVKRLINRSAVVNELNLFLDTVLHNTRFRNWFFGSLHADRQISSNMYCTWHEVYRIS